MRERLDSRIEQTMSLDGHSSKNRRIQILAWGFLLKYGSLCKRIRCLGNYSLGQVPHNRCVYMLYIYIEVEMTLGAL